ncbi:hypothetical protein B0H10DRAFT_2225593 [Mycena sp. CBHHK59/15]|nr:hypothetical protein B0H10DRAFT_2225593 [Mycena sp. CBHHK59/15]
MVVLHQLDTNSSPGTETSIHSSMESDSASQSSSLPIELIEQLMNHLHFHRKDLANCALVSHAWLICSRSHLIHSITFDRYSIKHKFSSLISLLECPLSSLPRCVKSIYTSGGFDDIFPNLGMLSCLAWVQKIVIQVSLPSTPFPGELEYTLVPITRAFPRVKAFSLSGGSFNFRQLATLMCGFSELETFDMLATNAPHNSSIGIRWCLGPTAMAVAF